MKSVSMLTGRKRSEINTKTQSSDATNEIKLKLIPEEKKNARPSFTENSIYSCGCWNVGNQLLITASF